MAPNFLPHALLIGAALLTAERGRAEDTAVVPPAPAAAPLEDARVPVARATFEEGIDLARQGRWTEALGAFEQSGRLWPHPVTTYNIGFCELSLGKYALAKKALSSALAARDRDGGAALPEDLRHSAEEYLVEGEQTLVHLVLRLVPGTARLSIDGRPLDILQDATGTSYALAGTRDRGSAEAIPGGKISTELDPGKHFFAVYQADGPASVVQRTFAPGAHEELTLVAPPAAAADRKAPVASVRSPGAPTHATLPDVAPSRTPAYVALGIGAAGLLTGSIAGVVAITKRATLDAQCPAHGCPPGNPTATLDTANTAATVADVGLAVGAVGIVAGAYLWWTTRPLPRATAQAAVEPSIGWRYAGVSGRF